MDQRLWPQRRLRDLALTDGRATARLVIRLLVLASTALTALAIVGESHRVCSSWTRCDRGDYGPSHTLLHDVGPAPFGFLVIIAVVQALAFRRRMLAGLFAAIGSLVAIVIVLGLVIFVHLLSTVMGDGGAALAALLVFVLCAAQVVLEPVLAVAERRRLERGDPVFPRATVVARRA